MGKKNQPSRALLVLKVGNGKIGLVEGTKEMDFTFEVQQLFTNGWFGFVNGRFVAMVDGRATCSQQPDGEWFWYFGGKKWPVNEEI